MSDPKMEVPAVPADEKPPRKWWETKTAKACAASIFGAGAAYFGGEIDMGAALQIVSTALIGFFLRLGQAKGGK